MIRILLAAPLAAALAIFAGAAAAHDFAIRPRFDLLALFGIYACTIVVLMTRPAAFTGSDRGRVSGLGLALLALLTCAPIVAVRGWPAFWIVAAIALLALAFTSGPRLADTGLAGAVTVAVFGPLASAGAAIAVAGNIPGAAWAIGLPVGLLADAARQASGAARAGSEPAAGGVPKVGTPPAPPWFAADLLAAYGLVPALVGAGTLPWFAFAAWFPLPWVLGELARVRGGVYDWDRAAVRARRLHVAFALLLGAAVLIARAIVTRIA